MTQKEFDIKWNELNILLQDLYKTKRNINSEINSIKEKMEDLKKDMVLDIFEYLYMIGKTFESNSYYMYRIDDMYSKNAEIFCTGIWVGKYEESLGKFETSWEKFDSNEYISINKNIFEEEYKKICDKLNLKEK